MALTCINSDLRRKQIHFGNYRNMNWKQSKRPKNACVRIWKQMHYKSQRTNRLTVLSLVSVRGLPIQCWSSSFP